MTDAVVEKFDCLKLFNVHLKLSTRVSSSYTSIEMRLTASLILLKFAPLYTTMLTSLTAITARMMVHRTKVHFWCCFSFLYCCVLFALCTLSEKFTRN
uniref:Uncharacterized protein n=1 Tax=Rhipicephalus zambeziensis TaxID=60191 RepID=A0A224Y9N5_9ACAR